MRYMTEKEYKARMRRIQAENASRKRIQQLKDEEKKYKYKRKLPSTSKLMATYLFVILNAVLVYAMVAMWCFRDLTYLGVLITDVAAQVLTYMIYSIKALKENTSKEGFVYEARTKELQHYKPTNIENDVDINAVG